ncbi:TetR/AcrR family transcriptional regulator [Nocardia sp. NPDC050175]|uniref:TetR/AcrR family transcriptional regulator n=1 Tax=Nocardia sp. NPDC050175 TaxID=3364317 RepID=UPI0037B19E3C
MPEKPRRTPTGAAVLQPQITTAVTEAVMAELATNGYARLSMEAVAKRAGAGKSALYRRWPSKQDMVIAVLAEFSVELAEFADTGALRTDLMASLRALHEWLTHSTMATILPDLTAEAGRNPVLAEAVRTTIGEPRRALGTQLLRRAIEREELPADTDVEMALDLIAGTMFWRLNVRHAEEGPDYLDRLADHLLRALNAR